MRGQMFLPEHMVSTTVCVGVRVHLFTTIYVI